MPMEPPVINVSRYDADVDQDDVEYFPTLCNFCDWEIGQSNQVQYKTDESFLASKNEEKSPFWTCLLMEKKIL